MASDDRDRVFREVSATGTREFALIDNNCLANAGSALGRILVPVLIDKQSLTTATYTTPTFVANFYQKLVFEIEMSSIAASVYWKYKVNSDTGTNYNDNLVNNGVGSLAIDNSYGVNGFGRFGVIGNGAANHNHVIFEFFPLNTGRRRFGYGRSYGEFGDAAATTYSCDARTQWRNTATDITSMTIFSDQAMTGTILVYGVPA